MQKLLIATRNKGKIQEIKQILQDVPVEIKTLDDLGIKDEVEETGQSYIENAIIKAKTIGKKAGVLTLAEDSGLEIDALNGWPGIHSARHTQGSDDDRIDKILEKMKGIAREKRTARYKANVALFIPSSISSTSRKRGSKGILDQVENDSKGTIRTFEGDTEGFITEKRIGKNGFGYDPIFWSKELKKTFGQASESEKNRVSHRARALEKPKKFLRYNK